MAPVNVEQYVRHSDLINLLDAAVQKRKRGRGPEQHFDPRDKFFGSVHRFIHCEASRADRDVCLPTRLWLYLPVLYLALPSARRTQQVMKFPEICQKNYFNFAFNFQAQGKFHLLDPRLEGAPSKSLSRRLGCDDLRLHLSLPHRRDPQIAIENSFQILRDRN